MNITIVPLEVGEFVFDGKTYFNVLARCAGKVVKFKLDQNAVVDVRDSIDKEVVVVLDITAGKQLAATPRIVSVE